MRKFFKEPLIHFMILGLLLFIGHEVWASKSGGSDRTIHVSWDTVERLKTIYAGEQRRPPNDDDVAALISSYIEEEALSREAERLGLGEDDTIIRRRLAQKMRFMTENVSRASPPSEEVLRKWYDENQTRFLEPKRISFEHIYISPDASSDFNTRAQDALTKVRAGEDWKTLGDPFIMSRTFTRVNQVDVKRSFGQSFADAIMSLESDTWLGPIESAYGLHLVRVSDVKAETQPDFETAKEQVTAAYIDESQRADNARKIQDIIDRYKIVMDHPAP